MTPRRISRISRMVLPQWAPLFLGLMPTNLVCFPLTGCSDATVATVATSTSHSSHSSQLFQLDLGNVFQPTTAVSGAGYASESYVRSKNGGALVLRPAWHAHEPAFAVVASTASGMRTQSPPAWHALTGVPGTPPTSQYNPPYNPRGVILAEGPLPAVRIATVREPARTPLRVLPQERYLPLPTLGRAPRSGGQNQAKKQESDHD
jgi:hypothetical protein